MDSKNTETRRFLAAKSENATEEREKKPRVYLLYCVMTLSVMLLTLAFASTELFSVFFSDVYPEKFVLSKLFGSEADSGKSLYELMLYQSFGDLSFNKDIISGGDGAADTPSPGESVALPETESPPESGGEITDAPDSSQSEPPAPVMPDGMLPVIGMDLSLSGFGNGYLHNTSSVEPDLSALGAFRLSTDLSEVYPSDAPLVLIVHTHGTEAYSDPNEPWYDPDSEVARSSDREKNVVRVGEIIAEVLRKNGIGTVHCTVMHDEESYSGSYERSEKTVKEYLAAHPSIKYIIDVHRDAVIKSGGELVGAVCDTEEGRSAQIMAVIGTGESTGTRVDYMANLALAQELRERLNSENGSFCRPTCLRPSAYNQQYGVYSILLEIGTAGNTLDEASLAARITAEALSNIIKGT